MPNQRHFRKRVVDRSHEQAVELPPEMTMTLITRTCRDVALAFVNGRTDWGKADIALWLMGPYARLLRCAGILGGQRGAARGLEFDLDDVDACSIDRVVESARAEVTSALTSVGGPNQLPAFAREMIACAYVVQCTDAHGGEGWVPSDSPRRLVDRVLSLFAADCLTRGEGRFARCAECASVSLRLEGEPNGCRSCLSSTGRTARNTLPYFARAA